MGVKNVKENVTYSSFFQTPKKLWLPFEAGEAPNGMNCYGWAHLKA